METIMNFLQQTGFSMIPENWKMLVMIAISLVLAYLAIVKKFEPLLLLPISFGMLLTNLPGAEMFHEQLFAGGHVNWDLLAGKTVEIDGVATTISAGLIDYLYLGVKLGIYPCLIFMGVGAGTDFEPLLANPKTLLLGAAAQLGSLSYLFWLAWLTTPRPKQVPSASLAARTVPRPSTPPSVWPPICWLPSR